MWRALVVVEMTLSLVADGGQKKKKATDAAYADYASLPGSPWNSSRNNNNGGCNNGDCIR